MEKNKTIAQQLGIKKFPFVIKNDNGKEIYSENSNFWCKTEYDVNGNKKYYEDSNHIWQKYYYNKNGKQTYYEDSSGYWCTSRYDKNGELIYREDSHGYRAGYNEFEKEIHYEYSDVKMVDDLSASDFMFVPKIELSMDEIAQKFNIPVSQLKIKK